MPAHYINSIARFLDDSTETIIGGLSVAASSEGFYQQLHSQTKSWEEQIASLKEAFSEIISKGHSVENWHILLEYPMPRREKRIDTVLLTENSILVIEYKCGAINFDLYSKLQVEDYCLDLRDFHLESKDLVIVPLLVATKAEKQTNYFGEKIDLIAPLIKSSSNDLGGNIVEAVQRYSSNKQINWVSWNKSSYQPTPTIIQSAQHLYSGQNVKEISRCSGGIENLTQTSDAVIQAINFAKEQNKKLICFVTGVPGAGKTLAGLNIVHNHSLHENELGIFLSGNGPLVKVLQEALARNYHQSGRSSLKEARRQVSTFIQNVHRFLDNYYEDNDSTPVDKVIIFDEAQRAWNSDQSKKKFDRNVSESELMIRIMDRHSDWAVIVALIGNGQEINTGEAGISEWGRALKEKYSHWNILISPKLLTTGGNSLDGLYESVPDDINIEENEHLHLDIPLRSYRSKLVAEFIDQLLQFNPEGARKIFTKISNYPLFRTRNLDDAKKWLKSKNRGTRRIGLIASSGARRLRAYGLDVTAELNVKDWFLNSQDDVRSSYSLETVCTEFGIQGLELDWTCVCWGGDFLPYNSDWKYQSFRGTKWQNINQESRKKYTLNKYRVLLTRAREGMVIWVPKGSSADSTRLPERFDAIDDYLNLCGIPKIKS